LRVTGLVMCGAFRVCDWYSTARPSAWLDTSVANSTPVVKCEFSTRGGRVTCAHGHREESFT
jgi:hypothetical protein